MGGTLASGRKRSLGQAMRRSLVPAKIESIWVLIDAHFVAEILGAEPWLPIPDARAELPGVVAWRGRAIPLIDLAGPLGLRPLSARQARERTLIVSVLQSAAALPVDAAREVHVFATEDLRPLHVRSLPYASAEIDTEGTVMAVIDLERLIKDLREQGQPS